MGRSLAARLTPAGLRQGFTVRSSDKQELQISMEVWTSYQALLTATEDPGNADDLLKSATQSLNVNQGRYKAGIGSMLDLLNAQSDLASRSAAAYSKHYRNWRTARSEVATSLGKPGLWVITEKSP